METKENVHLREFIREFTELIERDNSDEQIIIAEGTKLLSRLISTPDWLPGRCRQSHRDHYLQHLIYCDPQERFSVISAVWSPGQSVPAHNHTVWGLVGQLCGSETSTEYMHSGVGTPMVESNVVQLCPGQVLAVSPRIGDIHSVANNSSDELSISIHVYGGNIGKISRHMFDIETGEIREFISAF